MGGCCGCPTCADPINIKVPCSQWCKSDTTPWECAWKSACGGCAACSSTTTNATPAGLSVHDRSTIPSKPVLPLLYVEEDHGPPHGTGMKTHRMSNEVTHMVIMSNHAVRCVAEGWLDRIQQPLKGCGVSRADSVILDSYASQLRRLDCGCPTGTLFAVRENSPQRQPTWFFLIVFAILVKCPALPQLTRDS